MGTRKSFAGGAVETTLNGAISNVATTATLTSGATYPTTTGGPFVIVVDPGTASEEKILVATRATNALSGMTRGYDGTVAVAHSSGVIVRHVLDAVTVDEANAHANDTTSDVHPQYTTTAELATHAGAADPHPVYTTAVEVATAIDGSPRAQARRNSTQSITTGAWNLVTFNVEDVDTDTMFTTGTGDRFTCVTAGRYQVIFAATFATNVTGARGFAIAKGVIVGAGFHSASLIATSGGTVGTIQTVTAEVVLAAADTVSCQVFQNSGGALNLAADSAGEPCRATIRRVALT